MANFLAWEKQYKYEIYAAEEKGTAMMSKNNGMMKYHLLKRRCIIKQNTTSVIEKKTNM